MLVWIFLGYRASAGLGGLLTGDAAAGGLHAEAGTPHGQAAAAGLGGALNSNVKSGGLYAGATAGGDISASAALNGGATLTKTKTIVTEEQYPQPQTSYIQRTVIPNYVEKTVRVPTYVEKVVRVPSYVEKTVKVPVEPTVVEKVVETPVKVYKPHYRYHKFIGGGYGGYGGYGGNPYGSGNFQATISKTANPQLFDNIFAIPISTLGAVNNLLKGITGGVSGSVSVSKNVGVVAK